MIETKFNENNKIYEQQTKIMLKMNHFFV